MYINDQPITGRALLRAGWRQFSPWEVIKAKQRRPYEASAKTPAGWNVSDMERVVGLAADGCRGLLRATPLPPYNVIDKEGELRKDSAGKWFVYHFNVIEKETALKVGLAKKELQRV